MKDFVKIRGRPRESALGYALGIFIGMTPTMGIQMPIGFFFAAVFKCSKISAASGFWITYPFTAPFIYGIKYINGTNLLGLKAIMILPQETHGQIISFNFFKGTPELSAHF
ncbi:MAG: DUF2062 domain-containing protein [Desulfobacterales bacterium]|nr:DUF2062 domain-containing protein [Desulfobacterales bacterium]